MRKPIVTIASVLAIGFLVYVLGRVMLDADGPCTPKQPAPQGAAS